MASNLIVELTFEFSLEIIRYCEELEKQRKYVIARQLLKSGTSIGANVSEAQSPESKADFIHKMKIAAKEAFETAYWLVLCQKPENYPDCKILQEKILSIQRVLSKIINPSRSY